ncbi:MAG: N-acetyltransferase [Phycisphaeraceae bacterium]
MIRGATVADVPAMAQIINDAAEFGLMLPKSLAALYENVREFHVAVEGGRGEGTGNSKERVVGVCGLSIVWANLAEVASLAVRKDQRGKGLGKQLVQTVLDEAKQLGIPRVMTLTYERAFFEKLGFAVLDRQELPLKVWSECVRCPKNQACDEIAMVRRIEGVPEPEGAPAPPRPTRYEVPVVLTTRGKNGDAGK